MRSQQGRNSRNAHTAFQCGKMCSLSSAELRGFATHYRSLPTNPGRSVRKTIRISQNFLSIFMLSPTHVHIPSHCCVYPCCYRTHQWCDYKREIVQSGHIRWRSSHFARGKLPRYTVLKDDLTYLYLKIAPNLAIHRALTSANAGRPENL